MGIWCFKEGTGWVRVGVLRGVLGGWGFGVLWGGYWVGGWGFGVLRAVLGESGFGLLRGYWVGGGWCLKGWVGCLVS